MKQGDRYKQVGGGRHIGEQVIILKANDATVSYEPVKKLSRSQAVRQRMARDRFDTFFRRVNER